MEMQHERGLKAGVCVVSTGVNGVAELEKNLRRWDSQVSTGE